MIKTYPEMDREIVNLLDTTKPVQAYAAQRIRDLEQENAALTDGKFTYCVYCGKTYDTTEGDAADAIDKHVRECEKHPIAECRKENKSLKQRIRELTFQAEMFQAMFDEADTMIKLKTENTRLRRLAQDALEEQRKDGDR